MTLQKYCVDSVIYTLENTREFIINKHTKTAKRAVYENTAYIIARMIVEKFWSCCEPCEVLPIIYKAEEYEGDEQEKYLRGAFKRFIADYEHQGDERV
jgi:hypothetical protein